MGQVNTGRLNRGLLLKCLKRATLDPNAVSGQMSMPLFDELVATASIVAHPRGARRHCTLAAVACGCSDHCSDLPARREHDSSGSPVHTLDQPLRVSVTFTHPFSRSKKFYASHWLNEEFFTLAHKFR